MPAKFARAVWWALPWLIALAISTSIAYAMTAAIVRAAPYAAPVTSTAASVKAAVIGPTCANSPDAMLIYAQTSGHLPADYCPTPPR